MRSIAKQNYLSELKEIDWDFTGEKGSDGLAGYHWYPARYVPQLPGVLMNYFSEPGDTVLDPFCGSGTTLVEAFRFGRKAVGIDLNPIAILMSKAKLIPFDEEGVRSYAEAIATKADEFLRDWGPNEVRLSVPNYDENAKWYHSDTLRELASIWTAIQKHSDNPFFIVGLAAFSAILRHCSSQDKHWGWICDNVRPKRLIYRPTLVRFKGKLLEYLMAAKQLSTEASELQEIKIQSSEIMVYHGDCREVLSNFSQGEFDLAVTSPPYFNMTDYNRSQRLSFLWFQFDLEAVKAKEIGARYKRHRTNALTEYLQAMRDSFSLIAKVLKSGGFCCVVIGESPRHEPFLGELDLIYRESGLAFVDSLSRSIPKQRSLSPTLYEERIIILRKES